ncbi:MAG: 2Fe-2S iron-sulfur cluster-binding protein [Acidimicrobiales bacterium]
MTAPGFSALRVVAVDRDTPESVLLSLDAGNDPAFSFAHGQYLTFRHEVDGIELRRSYSICATAPSGVLRVGVKRVDGGAFSTWATSAVRVGDVLEAMAPMGSFTHALDPEAARVYVLVAGGSGITPIYSIAATVLATEPQSRVTLLQVDSTTSSIMLLDDVEALRNRYLDRFRIWRQLTQEPAGLSLLDGRPDEASLAECLRRGMLDADPDHVFLCGPEPLVELVTKVYTKLGVGPERIHTERFTTAQSGRARTRAQGPVDESVTPIGSGTAQLAGRRTEFSLYDGDTILDAVQRVRPDVPYACTAGVCSTCRAHLADGAVEMGVTYGLVPGEEDAGYVLTCQAVPTTSTVNVDFDA